MSQPEEIQFLKRIISECDAKLTDLAEQIRDLTDQYEEIEAERKSAQLLLDRRGGNSAHGHDARQEAAERGAIGNMPFRKAILYVLGRSNQGMGPTAVAKKLNELGYKVGGSTAIETRVANELSKLTEKDKVTRVKRGVYRVTERELRDLLQ